MTLVEELEHWARNEENPMLRGKLLRAAAMITALKEETLSLLNKPELPLRLEDWDVFWQPYLGDGPTLAGVRGAWVITAFPQGYIWAKRRASRPELPTLTEEK